MLNIEKEELAKRAKGMSEEELEVVSKFIPTGILWDELRRREEMQRKILGNVNSVLSGKEES